MADPAAKTPDDDPYAVLGLTKTASEAEIKSAYRRLVRLNHPDINPDDKGAAARFVRITNAHDLLKDPATRARFDAGEIDAKGQERPQRQYYRDFAGAHPGGGYGGMDVDDMFSEIFGQRGGQGFQRQGQDLGYTLQVPFLDAARGGTARINLPGEGQVDVTIPQGLRDGQTLRLRGKGGAAVGGAARGDALVTVLVQPHPLFRREGDDILLTLPITIDEAVLGARVEVPTIEGDIAVTVPKGSASGRVLRLRGRGVKGLGDQLVELRIVVPKPEDAALAAFLEGWRKGRHDDPRAAMLKGVPR